MALAKGYDVSDFQSRTPADAEFVFVKASEGARTAQSGYADKVADARDRGLVVGHYHFLHAEQNVEGEIDHFCRVVGTVPAGELLALDFEPYDQGVTATAATTAKNAWLAAVKKRYPHNLVGLYADTNWWFSTDDTCGDYLWIADYDHPAGSPGIQASWRVHQYTAKPLDTNVFHGTLSEMRAWIAAATGAAGQGGGPDALT